MLHLWVTVLSLLAVTTGLDNGLGLTPPMGILFRCSVNCDNFPDGCLNEDLVRSTADKFAEDGYQDAGYEYIILGDCVTSKERDAYGKLQPDPNRFASGFKNLSDYIHSKGLKFGMYTNYGTSTCAGYPGLIGHMEQDIKQFASEWEVDYLKVDNCNTDYSTDIQGYTEIGRLLNETGRPIYLQCEWSGSEVTNNITPDWSSIPALCNSWRTYIDIVDGYTSLVKIVEYMAENQDTFVPLAGPGHWNDPDVLTVGNKAMLRSWQQMALWSVMASPLIMSTKLDELGGGDETLLKNKDVIAVNQDPLGRMGAGYSGTHPTRSGPDPSVPWWESRHPTLWCSPSQPRDRTPRCGPPLWESTDWTTLPDTASSICIVGSIWGCIYLTRDLPSRSIQEMLSCCPHECKKSRESN